MDRILLLMLVLVPAGHFLVVSVAGAMAAAADLVVAGGVLGAGTLLLLKPGRALAVVRDPGPVDLGFLLLAAFGVYTAASGLWGHHPAYALAKGAGYTGLAAAGWLLARSGTGWVRAADAWLLGTGVALGLTLLCLAVGGLGGASFLWERVVYRGGAVHGLAFPRLRGPFLHPNLMGDYLVVSAVILWGRWPQLRAHLPRASMVLAGAISLGLLLTVPSAWVALGPLLVGWGVCRLHGSLGFGWVALGLGTVLTSVCLVGLLLPLRLELGFATVASEGLRPRIWVSTLDAILSAPFLGVGASPFLAAVADPTLSGGVGLWEAHSVYLGVFGQFGAAGALLLGGGVVVLLQGVRAGPRSRGGVAVLLALAAVGIHAFFSGSEDFRHVWLLMGMLGVVAMERSMEEGR